MNLLMSHMTDFLNLEAYKKTEGNEAQAKKYLGQSRAQRWQAEDLFVGFLDSKRGCMINHGQFSWEVCSYFFAPIGCNNAKLLELERLKPPICWFDMILWRAHIRSRRHNEPHMTPRNKGHVPLGANSDHLQPMGLILQGWGLVVAVMHSSHTICQVWKCCYSLLMFDKSWHRFVVPLVLAAYSKNLCWTSKEHHHHDRCCGGHWFEVLIENWW